jgi:DNA-binding Xre family transcriptional regulator
MSNANEIKQYKELLDCGAISQEEFDMKKKELCQKAGISSSSLTKMGKGGHVTTEVLAKICTALDCTVDDIMEIITEDENA